MSENLARCRRCHDVFDPDAGVCPRCGTPWQPIAAPPPIDQGTFSERYAGTTLTEPLTEGPEVVPHGNKKVVMSLVAAGCGLIAVAAVVGTLFAMGTFAPQATNPPIIVSLGPVTPPPPTPTPVPETAMALSAINDPNLNAHVLIQSRIDEDSIITGHPYSSAITFDSKLSNGREMGTYTQGAKTEEFRYVDGKFFIRTLPAGKWVSTPSISSWAIILPLFNLKTSKMIEFVGQEERDGEQAYHFRSTKWWVPDLNRMGFVDISALGLKPDTVTLDLWTTSFGWPTYASFSGVSMATDGRKLLDIETTYTFSDVGTSVDIVNPLATPVPSASASATAN